jgi:predicted acetyltransferase
MPITYRAIVPEEADAFFDADSYGFGHDPNLEWRAASLEYADLTRTVAAFDGSEIVGTAGAWTFDLTVPGNAIPCGGVTWVAVIPTHRRRGVLTGMMRTQLEGIRERGEAIAALWASEAPIYSRFGYGLAAEGVEMHIERVHAAIRHRVPYTGRVRRVEREEALVAWPGIYERVRIETPGFLSRSPKWWSNRIIRPANLEWRSGAVGLSRAFLVQYEEDGEPLGYVRYHIRSDEHEGVPTSDLRIFELIAASDAAHAALCDYVVGVDLIKTIRWEWARVDEPLVYMLADPRRLVRRTQDTLWVRLLDVARALESRKYASEGRIVFEVADPFLPWAGGRFALEAGRRGARCTRTTESADIELTTVELAAAYLGHTRFQQLARAGRVYGSRDVLRTADALFTWDPLPWCPEIF